MRSPTSDPQEWRCYDWETDLMSWAGARATKREIKRVIARCCRMYRVPVPKLHLATKDRRDGRKLASNYDPNTHTILLRPRHWDLCTAIHEVAHAIANWVLGNLSQLHGPEWLGIHMVLLSKNKILPLTALQQHARTRRLKFCAAERMSPTQIRREFASKVRKACRDREQER
jgi:hypothetical protein